MINIPIIADDEGDTHGDDYVGLKGQKKCACGHSRRVHVRRKVREEPVKYEHGQCLGGTPAGPMSCECMGFGE